MTAGKQSSPQITPDKISIAVSLANRERLNLELEVSSDGAILKSRLTGIGCSALLKVMSEWRTKLSGKLSEVPLPKGEGHEAILMRELLLKARGEWQFPYAEEELCHCRAVPTVKVDAAIIGGCHSVGAVSRETSASTSCGTCRLDVEAILKYRLAKED